MSLLDKILGRPLASWEGAKQKLSVITGVPVLGLDALASTGYGPEAALTILLPLGVMGLSYFPIIILAIIVTLGSLYLSYRQTIAAYPNGGGAYIVAKDNLGTHARLVGGCRFAPGLPSECHRGNCGRDRRSGLGDSGTASVHTSALSPRPVRCWQLLTCVAFANRD